MVVFEMLTKTNMSKMLAVVVETTTVITYGKTPSGYSDDNRKGTPTIILGTEIRRNI